ncbi:hypothetical protein QBC37DRAFT_356340 [Rhypophila decipiens]|uniref:Uncharacterized protein n=1 Tax=Rhypophila decipiens TaxID=261697 RepID=A0AAN6XW74_9PEZI|nr:hypothetical protein QBC37DRAFT_356340 [Rhypophila decipiens]
MANSPPKTDHDDVGTQLKVDSSQDQQDHDALELEFADDGEGPMVRAYGSQTAKFMLGDKVFLSAGRSREGPFLIEAFVDGNYRLCSEAGATAKNGELFSEGDLVLYNPFG